MDGPHHIKVAFMFRDVKPMHPDKVKSNPVLKEELELLYRETEQEVPGCKGQIFKYSKCHYTMSPDGSFIIDKAPGSERCHFAGGFSGRGFKFMPVIGKIMSELALDGKSSIPIDFLSLKRFDLDQYINKNTKSNHI